MDHAIVEDQQDEEHDAEDAPGLPAHVELLRHSVEHHIVVARSLEDAPDMPQNQAKMGANNTGFRVVLRPVVARTLWRRPGIHVSPCRHFGSRYHLGTWNDHVRGFSDLVHFHLPARRNNRSASPFSERLASRTIVSFCVPERASKISTLGDHFPHLLTNASGIGFRRPRKSHFPSLPDVR